MPSPSYKAELLNALEKVAGDDLRERVAQLLYESRVTGEQWPNLLLDPEVQGNPLTLVAARKAARDHEECERYLLQWLLEGVK